jgi:hypothetical protein
MVDRTEGQFYTMEGIAAAVLMVLTAYLVMSTTSVYTPGDTHIIDMQLEQVGSDALKIMDTKTDQSENLSDLEWYIWNNNAAGFDAAFGSLINANNPGTNPVKYKADIYYVTSTNNVSKYEFLPASNYIGDVNGVSVYRWVFVQNPTSPPTPYEHRNQTVLLEVLLWRD